MHLIDVRAPATLEGVSTLRRALRRCLSELRLPIDPVDDLQLAVSELGSNIIQHGRPAAGVLRLIVGIERHLLRVEIEDDGGPFENFEVRVGSARTARDSVRQSGMGLDFIRNSVDTVQYRAGPPNRTVLIRRLHGRRPRILLIEDDAVLRAVYSEMLGRHFEPVAAASMAEARAIVEANPPDLVIADLHLGDGKGNDASALFARPNQQLPVPLLILTGDRRPAVRASLMRDGVDAVLSKPISARDLQSAVRGGLARSARQQAVVLSGLGGLFERITLSTSCASAADWQIGHAHSPAGFGGGDIALVLAGVDRTRVVLADVMGHGLQARVSALAFACALRAVHAAGAQDPSAFLQALNRVMFGDPVLGGIFATVQVVDLLAGRRMSVASAGHPEPWIADPAGACRRVEVDGPALGLMQSIAYATLEVMLGDGERLLLMTDGLGPEDLTGGGRLPDWLSAAAAECRDAAPQAAAAHVGKAIEVQLMPEQIDDWTIMVLEPAGRHPAER